MSIFNTDKIYESLKISEEPHIKDIEASQSPAHAKTTKSASLDEGLFYEIEYDSSPMPGVGRFVLKSQKVEEPQNDPIRDLFNQMRDISRSYRSTYNNSNFYDPRVQSFNAIIFYKQGMFMKDFSDSYTEIIPFSQYFPNYQMMGYKQLRTYFTWRTNVRKGIVTDISLSYVFLYIYELLSNIGVKDPQDGLNQLLSFWKAFSSYNNSIDKYLLRWLKDYHIYYELPLSFKDFIDAHHLTDHYPDILNTEDNFDLFCNISKYDIRKSKYFTDDKVKLIEDCFSYVINILRQTFNDSGIPFDDAIFQPTKKTSQWKPFKDAVFSQWMKQADRRLVLSEKEIYIYKNNNCVFCTAITSENGRQLIGYIMKQMEVALRKMTKYKYKLSANLETVNHEAIDKLSKLGLSLEKIINDAVMAFYKEETKTVVRVDKEALYRIRQEALLTQEKLLVPEHDNHSLPVVHLQETLDLSSMTMQKGASIQSSATVQNTEIVPNAPWDGLKNSFTKAELKALSVVPMGEVELKKYADDCGIMLEVLVEGINEKAMDFIGDSLIDDDFSFYDEYIKQVKELIG